MLDTYHGLSNIFSRQTPRIENNNVKNNDNDVTWDGDTSNLYVSYLYTDSRPYDTCKDTLPPPSFLSEANIVMH